MRLRTHTHKFVDALMTGKERAGGTVVPVF